MKTNLKKTVEYLKKNKKQIFIVSGCVAVGVITFAITKQKLKVFENSNVLPENFKATEHFKIPECFRKPERLDINVGIGNVTEALKYESGNVELMMDKIPLNELGNLGEKIASELSLNVEDSEVWALLNIGQK